MKFIFSIKPSSKKSSNPQRASDQNRTSDMEDNSNDINNSLNGNNTTTNYSTVSNKNLTANRNTASPEARQMAVSPVNKDDNNNDKITSDADKDNDRAPTRTLNNSPTFQHTTHTGHNLNKNLNTSSSLPAMGARQLVDDNATANLAQCVARRPHRRPLLRDDSGNCSSSGSDDGDPTSSNHVTECSCGPSRPDRPRHDRKNQGRSFPKKPVISRSVSLTSIDSAMYDSISINAHGPVCNLPPSASSSTSSLSSLWSLATGSRTSLSCGECSLDSLNFSNSGSNHFTSESAHASTIHRLSTLQTQIGERFKVNNPKPSQSNKSLEKQSYIRNTLSLAVDSQSSSHSQPTVEANIIKTESEIQACVEVVSQSPKEASPLSQIPLLCGVKGTLRDIEESSANRSSTSVLASRRRRRYRTASSTSDDNDIHPTIVAHDITPFDPRPPTPPRSRPADAQTAAARAQSLDFNNNSGVHDKSRLQSYLPASPGRFYDYFNENGILCFFVLIAYTLCMVVASAFVGVVADGVKTAVGKRELSEMRKSLTRARRNRCVVATSD